MAPPEDPPGGGEAGSGGAAEDPLRRLEERLDRASDAAERLLSEAAAGATRAAKAASEIPAAGWQLPRSGSETGDLELVAQLIQSLRDLIPDELERRLAEALRELLLALRALIDWYLERGERRRAEPSEVQDIPIA
jgi:hypothetical protein